MFDGSLENPIALVLLLLAFTVAAPAGWFAARRAREAGSGGEGLFALAALGLVWGVLTPLAVVNRKLGEPMVWIFGREGMDTGVVEYATVLLFAWSGLAAAWLARRGRGLQRWVFALGAAACLLIAGEEMSWGQWLFHWSTPEPIAAVNLQDETNVHNLMGPQGWEFAYSLGGFVLIAAVMIMRFAPVARRIDFAPLAVFRTSRWAAPLALSAGVMMQHHFLQELSELMLAAAVAHAVGWIAARTPGKAPSQRLAPA